MTIKIRKNKTYNILHSGMKVVAKCIDSKMQIFEYKDPWYSHVNRVNYVMKLNILSEFIERVN